MKQKLYCYVDETGQDTKGEFFIVIALVIGDEKEKLETFLEKVEVESGKGKRKWIKSRIKEKEKYIKDALVATYLKEKIFYKIEKNTKAYEAQTVVTIEQAIRQFVTLNNIKDYKATIVIDGLSETSALRIGSTLRRAGIKTRKVKGAKDESNAMLRLADIIAGLVRESEGKNPAYKPLVKKLEKERILNEL